MRLLKNPAQASAMSSPYQCRKLTSSCAISSSAPVPEAHRNLCRKLIDTCLYLSNTLTHTCGQGVDIVGGGGPPQAPTLPMTIAITIDLYGGTSSFAGSFTRGLLGKKSAREG